nr:MAG TPA: hypothetical protein [Caudoviricetes sp.]
MNFEEIQKLKGGDFVQEQVTGAIFEVIRTDFYPDELKEENYVSIPLYVKLVHLPEGVEGIRSGDNEDEVFRKEGDCDYVYYDLESYRNAELSPDYSYVLTCQDLEKVEVEYRVKGEKVKDLKPENITSFKSEGLIEFSDEAEEAALAENLIFPVEEARANKEKFFNLKRELVQISQLIKEASAQGKSCVRIPADLDRLEITTQFSRAGYKIYAGCIAW